jgi:hypothetical protein
MTSEERARTGATADCGKHSHEQTAGVRIADERSREER